MGLLDFFKKKPAAATPAKTPNTPTGDLSKTAILYHLVQTPKNARDEKWQNTFLENVATASFRCDDPQVQTGPDGFPYLQLHLPEPNTEFNCHVIKNEVNGLLESGLGIAINPTSQGADWVFSYGDILCYQLNNDFYENPNNMFSNKAGKEVLNEAEEVLIAQPSEAILPKASRKVLSEFLKANGIQSPKIMLMSRANNGNISTDLVFNVTEDQCKSEEHFRYVMRSIGWYLPKHYTYISIDDRTLGGFDTL